MAGTTRTKRPASGAASPSRPSKRPRVSAPANPSARSPRRSYKRPPTHREEDDEENDEEEEEEQSEEDEDVGARPSKRPNVMHTPTAGRRTSRQSRVTSGRSGRSSATARTASVHTPSTGWADRGEDSSPSPPLAFTPAADRRRASASHRLPRQPPPASSSRTGALWGGSDSGVETEPFSDVSDPDGPGSDEEVAGDHSSRKGKKVAAMKRKTPATTPPVETQVASSDLSDGTQSADESDVSQDTEWSETDVAAENNVDVVANEINAVQSDLPVGVWPWEWVVAVAVVLLAAVGIAWSGVALSQPAVSDAFEVEWTPWLRDATPAWERGGGGGGSTSRVPRNATEWARSLVMCSQSADEQHMVAWGSRSPSQKQVPLGLWFYGGAGLQGESPDALRAWLMQEAMPSHTSQQCTRCPPWVVCRSGKMERCHPNDWWSMAPVRNNNGIGCRQNPAYSTALSATVDGVLSWLHGRAEQRLCRDISTWRWLWLMLVRRTIHWESIQDVSASVFPPSGGISRARQLSRDGHQNSIPVDWSGWQRAVDSIRIAPHALFLHWASAKGWMQETWTQPSVQHQLENVVHEAMNVVLFLGKEPHAVPAGLAALGVYVKEDDDDAVDVNRLTEATEDGDTRRLEGQEPIVRIGIDWSVVVPTQSSLQCRMRVATVRHWWVR